MGGEVGDQGFEVGHIGSEEKQAVKVLEIYKIIVHTYMQQYSIRMKNLRKKNHYKTKLKLVRCYANCTQIEEK